MNLSLRQWMKPKWQKNLSKEKRETYHSLKEGKEFHRKLWILATDPEIKNLHPDDYLIALDGLKKIAGITNKD